MTYQDFLDQKRQVGAEHGFEPVFMPDQLFDFQRSLVALLTIPTEPSS